MKTTKIIHIGQERPLLKPSVFLQDKENIFLENPINTPIESPSHLIEIPSDGVCPVIKNGTFKEGEYLLFSTLLFVCKLQTDSKIFDLTAKIFDCNLAAKVSRNIANTNTEYKYMLM